MTKLMKVKDIDGNFVWKACVTIPSDKPSKRTRSHTRVFFKLEEASQWIEKVEMEMDGGKIFKPYHPINRTAYIHLTVKETIEKVLCGLEKLANRKVYFTIDEILSLLGDRAECYVGKAPGRRIQSYKPATK